MLRRLAFAFVLTCSGAGYAQETRLDFAGVPANASVGSLAAAGFSCNFVGRPDDVLCVSEQVGFAEFGIPIYRREARVMNSVLVYIRAISAPAKDSTTLVQSTVTRFSSMFREKERPRFLDLVDNSHRRFYAIAPRQTLAVSVVPVANASGGGSVSMALFFPAAH